MQATFRDRFPVAEGTYWKDLFFSDEFQQRMYREALGCTVVEIPAQAGDLAQGLTRTLRFTQPLDAPAVVRKVFGDSTTIVEQGAFDPAAGRWRFTMRPNRMPDRVIIHGETWLEAVSGGIDRVSRLDVSVTMFGLGAIVERVIAHSSKKQYRKQADFMRRYIDEKQLR